MTKFDDKPTTEPAAELDAADLDAAVGGIAMLLPAVQSAREAARRTSKAAPAGKFDFQGGDDFASR